MAHILQHAAALGPHEIIGIVGFLIYMTAFGAVQLGRMDGNSTAYSLCNVVAASLVGISLFQDFNLASALIQGSWIAFGLIGLSLRAWQTWPSTRRDLNATHDAEVA